MKKSMLKVVMLSVAILPIASSVKAVDFGGLAAKAAPQAIEHLERLARRVQAEVGKTAITADSVKKIVKTAVNEIPDVLLGVDLTDVKKGRLSSDRERVVLRAIRGNLPTAINALDMVIAQGRLDQLSSMITFGFGYVKNDLKLLPGQLDGVYSQLHTLASKHPSDINKAGRLMRAFAVGIRRHLRALNQEGVSRETVINRVAAIVNGLNTGAHNVLMPLVEEHKTSLMAFFTSLRAIHWKDINFGELRQGAGAALKKLEATAGADAAGMARRYVGNVGVS